MWRVKVLINTSEAYWYHVVIPVCLLLTQTSLLSFLALRSLFLSKTSRKKKRNLVSGSSICFWSLDLWWNRSSMFLTSNDTSFQKAAWKDLKGSISEVAAAIVLLLVIQQGLPICSKNIETTSWLKSYITRVNSMK